MCGIVTFFGQCNGLTHVIEALHLLEYRAPDSSGLATITETGDLSLRRAVGTPEKLLSKITDEPLFPSVQSNRQAAAALLTKQGLNFDPPSLRDCSAYTLDDIYRVPGVQIGIGDFSPAPAPEAPVHFSQRMAQALQESGTPPSFTTNRDPVQHAFHLVATHIASRVELDEAMRQTLDSALLARIPANRDTTWKHAWAEETTANTPGHAFAVAVRHFQETFPDLAEHLKNDDWERVGGLTALAMAQIVVGHGRWAMVGAVNEINAHPLLDRSRTRAVCENGSHNATYLLKMRTEQDEWWRARGLSQNEPVHTSENTTEVIAFEWERTTHKILENDLSPDDTGFLMGLAERGIDDCEEQALRLTLQRLRQGNAHACTFYSRHRPGILYVSSHNKPIAIATRTIIMAEGQTRQEVMVASDVNAALMLWPGDEVDEVAQQIHAVQTAANTGELDKAETQQTISQIVDKFIVDVIFLDTDLHQGKELLARIFNQFENGQVVPTVQISSYDGTPLVVTPQQMHLNPAMVGKQGFPSYTEAHIAEIPNVTDGLIRTYLQNRKINLTSVWRKGKLFQPGLNIGFLRNHFDDDLKRLRRLLLIGEGSSRRDAQAGALLFRELLPGVLVNVYRPVQVLNLGTTINPATDLALEISWSGTTDSLLKVDNWLSEMGVMRLAITGRPQSVLGRRTANSAGTLDVQTGVEASVATVKGFHAILMTLNLCAIQLATIRPGSANNVAALTRLIDELTWIIPRHIRMLINDEKRRAHIRRAAERCCHFNKVAVVGNSPIVVEAELKIEELAQIVANSFEFHTASLRSLVEHSALVEHDYQRTLFIVNVTSSEAYQEALPVINYLHELGVFCLIHTTAHTQSSVWQSMPNTEVFVSPPVSEFMQPLIDVLFFFDLAVALAYARGLLPNEIDRPRNLAKSVTTTGAERRTEVETRQELHNITLADFNTGRLARTAWNGISDKPSRVALQATIALRAAVSVISRPLPPQLTLRQLEHLVTITDTESTENGVNMAVAAWQELVGIELTVYRRFISDLPQVPSDTTLLRLIRAGSMLSVRDDQTIAFPSDLSPLQMELLGAVYFIGLAVRLARQQGAETGLWEVALAKLPLVVAELLADEELARTISNVLSPFINLKYDKAQIIGGGQDHTSAISIARSLRRQGFMAEAQYTDSAWHGPLATVGGPDAEHDTLIIILATDPLFQAAALVDTQVYRTRNANVILVVPEGNQDAAAVRGVKANAVLAVPAVPRLFVPIINAALGEMMARQIARLWQDEYS